MKNWLKFAAVLTLGAFLFTACSDDDDDDVEIFLNVPADATLNLGADFDPMEGVSVQGTSIDNVEWVVNPEWNKHLVNHYVFTYVAGDKNAERNVYIQVDNLLGTYVVSDEDADGTTYTPYSVTVTKGNAYNKLRFNDLYYPDFIVNANVIGSVIEIPEQTHQNVTVEGTGTYDGENGVILTIDYIIDGVEGTSTFD